MALDQTGGLASQSGDSIINSWRGAAIIVLVALVVLIAAFVFGRNAQAGAGSADAALIEDENKTFCTGLRLAPASDLYSQCANGLMDIRRRHGQRISAAVGVL